MTDPFLCEGHSCSSNSSRFRDAVLGDAPVVSLGPIGDVQQVQASEYAVVQLTHACKCARDISDVACTLILARCLNGTDVVSKFLRPNPTAAPLLVSDFPPAVACISSHPRGDGVVVESVYHGQDLQLSLDVDVISSSLKGSLVPRSLLEASVRCRGARQGRFPSVRPGSRCPQVPDATDPSCSVELTGSEVTGAEGLRCNAAVPGAEGPGCIAEVTGAKGPRCTAEVRAEVSGATGPACIAEVTGANEVTLESLQWLVSELQGQILSSCRHLHANFVLQWCIELLEPHFDAVSVAVHVGDCRVLHWLIEHGSCKPQLTQPVDSILGIVEKVERPLTQQAESTLCPKPRILDVACVARRARSLNGTDVVNTCLGPNPDAAPMLVSDTTALKKCQTA